MNNEPTNNDVSFVDPNTDDLDAFTALMTGKAQVATEEPVPSEDKPEVETKEVVEVEDTSEDSVDDEVKNDNEADPDEDEPKVEEKPKKVSKFQERINKVLERERLAKEEAEALRKQIAELSKEKEVTPSSKPTAQQDEGPSPDAKNDDGSDKYPLGEFDPNYIRDLTRFTIQAEQKAAKEQQEQEAAQKFEKEARESLNVGWQEKLSTATEKYDDFLDKTIELEDTFEGLDANYADYLVQTIKSLDNGADVLYYFANHLDEAQKFVKLGPLAATLALGEYNAKFKKESVTKENKVSKAPPPPQVVNKGTKSSISVSPDTDDLAAFEKAFFKPK